MGEPERAAQQPVTSTAGIDVKVWIAGILLVVGILVGVWFTRMQLSPVTDKWKEAAKTAEQKMNEARAVVGSTQKFIMAVKAKHPDVYQEAASGLPPQAQKDLDKLTR